MVWEAEVLGECMRCGGEMTIAPYLMGIALGGAYLCDPCFYGVYHGSWARARAALDLESAGEGEDGEDDGPDGDGPTPSALTTLALALALARALARRPCTAAPIPPGRARPPQPCHPPAYRPPSG
jgi:hypothetical protein